MQEVELFLFLIHDILLEYGVFLIIAARLLRDDDVGSALAGPTARSPASAPTPR